MSTNEIILVARRILQDNVSPYRWTDAELKEDLQFGVRELNKIRPETRYVGNVLTDGVDLPNDNTANINIADKYKECLVHYVVYMAYLNDSSDTVNLELSNSYYQKFVAKVQV